MVKSSDSKIIDAIQSGNDDDALQLLYKTALPNITRFILRNNGDREEAKDIFQDSVIALYNTIKLGKYDASKQIDAFLFHVAKNLWINRIKKKNRQFNIEDAEEQITHETPYAIITTSEKQLAIEGLMEKIGGPCREIMRLVMYEKKTMKEIAAKMGLAGENVAKTTHYKCKQKLAAMIYANKNLVYLLKE